MYNCKTIDLLKCIAKTSMNSSERELFCTHLDSFNDPFFLNLLEVHKINFLFYKHLYDYGLLADKNYYKYMFSLGERFVFLQNKFKEYTEEVEKLTRCFNENSISYAILKGFSLMYPIYEKNGKIYRNFNDVDVLISKKDVNLLNDLLVSNQFTQSKIDENYELCPIDKREKIYWRLNSHQEHEYIKKSKYFNFAPHLLLYLDVNFSIFKGGKYEDNIATETLLKYTIKREEKSIIFNSLDNTYELIQLCCHFYKDIYYDVKKLSHDHYNLIKFCDIREYIIKYSDNIDWDRFTEILKKCKLENEITYVLSLVLSFYDDEELFDVLSKVNINVQRSFNWEEMLL